jgi:hypothetical protein
MIKRSHLLVIALTAVILVCGGCLTPRKVDHLKLVGGEPAEYAIQFGQWLIFSGPCMAPFPMKDEASIYVGRIEGTIPAGELRICVYTNYLSNITGSVSFTNNRLRVNLNQPEYRPGSHEIVGSRPWHFDGEYKLPPVERP